MLPPLWVFVHYHNSLLFTLKENFRETLWIAPHVKCFVNKADLSNSFLKYKYLLLHWETKFPGELWEKNTYKERTSHLWERICTKPQKESNKTLLETLNNLQVGKVHIMENSSRHKHIPITVRKTTHSPYRFIMPLKILFPV